MSKETAPGGVPVIPEHSLHDIHYCEGMGCLAALFSIPGQLPLSETLSLLGWTTAAGKLWCAMHREEGEARAHGRCDECGMLEGEHTTTCLRARDVVRPALAVPGLPVEWWRTAAVAFDQNLEAARTRIAELERQLEDALRSQAPTFIVAPIAQPGGGFKRGSLAILGAPATSPAERLLRRVARFALGDDALAMSLDAMRTELPLVLLRKWRLGASAAFVQAELEESQGALTAARAEVERVKAHACSFSCVDTETVVVQRQDSERGETARESMRELASLFDCGEEKVVPRAATLLRERAALRTQVQSVRERMKVGQQQGEYFPPETILLLIPALSTQGAANSPAVPDGSPALGREDGTAPEEPKASESPCPFSAHLGPCAVCESSAGLGRKQ